MIKIELTGTDTATCGDIVVKAKVSPIGKIARKLISDGVDDGRIVQVYRGSTKCFADASVLAWSKLTTSENDASSVRHIDYVPFSGVAS